MLLFLVVCKSPETDGTKNRRNGDKMKKDTHPEYVETKVRCSCGEEFTTRSTTPEINIEICSACHPFYTGKRKLVDSGGRVERFERKYGKRKVS